MTGIVGALTATELRSAPDVVAGLLDLLDRAAATLAGRLGRGPVSFVGAGSSHLVGGIAATRLRRRAGNAAEALVASEVAFDPGAVLPPPVVVAISRSGRTTETLGAVAALRAGTPYVVALVCDGDSPLAAAAHKVVAMPEAAERAVAQTRSVAAALSFGLLLAERAIGVDGRPALGAALGALAASHERWSGEADALAATCGGRLVLLGGAERWWLAREIGLKATEMGRVDTIVERVLEMPHGPIEGLTAADTVVVLPAPDRSQQAGLEAAVVARLRTIAGRVVVVGDDAFATNPATGGVVEPLLLQLHAGHLLGLALAASRGVDADRPARLTPYITLADG